MSMQVSQPALEAFVRRASDLVVFAVYTGHLYNKANKAKGTLTASSLI